MEESKIEKCSVKEAKWLSKNFNSDLCTMFVSDVDFIIEALGWRGLRTETPEFNYRKAFAVWGGENEETMGALSNLSMHIFNLSIKCASTVMHNDLVTNLSIIATALAEAHEDATNEWLKAGKIAPGYISFKDQLTGIENYANKYHEGKYSIFALPKGYKGCFSTPTEGIDNFIDFLPNHKNIEDLLHQMLKTPYRYTYNEENKYTSGLLKHSEKEPQFSESFKNLKITPETIKEHVKKLEEEFNNDDLPF